MRVYICAKLIISIQFNWEYLWPLLQVAPFKW